MLDTIYEYDRKKEQIKTVNKAILIVTMIMLAIVPLIVYRHDAPSFGPIFDGNVYVTGMRIDVFNYYKAVLLNIITLIMLGLFIYRTVVLKDEIKINKMNILVMFLAILIMIVPLLSKYTDIAFWGNYDRHEGSYAWFSYLIIFFILYNTKIEKKHVKYFYWALMPFVAINLILGLLNLYGYNIIENQTVNKMLGGDLTGYLVTTVYNPNYGSGISAVIFSISFMYLLLEKNIKTKIALLITTVASFTMLLSMTSSGGFVTVLILLPIILVIGIRFRGIKNTVIWTIPTFVLNAILYTILSKANERVYDESFKMIEKINSISVAIIPAAIIGFILVVFLMKFINRKVVFNVVIGLTVISMLVGGVVLSNTLDNNKEAITENTIYKKLNEMSTDRINIWLKTVDLINERPILGQGFDTYPYVMLENDADKGISTYGEFIDKPHNWYLTVAYGSGILGLVGFLAILISILKGLFDKVSDKIDDKYIYILGIGFIAYAVQGLSNDSWIGTSIIFWIIAGVCANRIFRENLN